MEEFCDHPNLGHLVLIEFMEDLPKALETKMPFPVLQRMPVCQGRGDWVVLD
jgi:hypothetical protein